MKPYVPVGAVAFVLLSGCAGVDSLDDFRGAVRAGASCEELFDQRANFSDEDTLAQIDVELDRVGCDEPASTRTDQ